MARGRGWLVLLTGLLGVCTVLADHHTPPPHGEAENHVEDGHLENALEDWLYNFDTYTFMVKQHLDYDHHDATQDPEEELEGPEEENEVEEEEVVEEEEEEEDDDDEREFWTAPITVTLDEHGLLNPHQDYDVTVESLVAEAGTIFVTLSKYDNKSRCGVGGMTQQDPATPTHLHTRTLNIGDHLNHTLINFNIQDQDNASRSEWVEVSEEYWWASGRLAGGDVLALTFTPPECGCLTLSTYYALPAGNLTLVVGPQAYPRELQMLLCVDHLASHEDSDDYEENSDESDTDESDYEEEEEEGAGEESAALTARVNVEGEGSGEGPRTHIVTGRSTRQKTRKEKKIAKRLAKKRKRQQKRQKIRQAGRRQARRQAPRNNPRNGHRRNRGQRNHGRQAKKAWKKIQRQNRRQRKINRRRNQSAVLQGDSETGNNTEGELGDQEGHNTTHPQAELEKLVNFLLGNATGGNTTQEDSEGSGRGENGEEPSESENEDEDEGEEGRAGRGRHRMNRQQRKKMRRRERKKLEHPPGIKFCCKQGVKHKKYILIFNATEGQTAPSTCNTNNEVVTTFANHQFNVAKAQCHATFQTCCTKFTSDVWDQIKARKAARRKQRQQRRKSRRQQRMQVRKRNRKGNRRQNRHHGGDREVLVREEDAGVPEVEVK